MHDTPASLKSAFSLHAIIGAAIICALMLVLFIRIDPNQLQISRKNSGDQSKIAP